MATDRRVAVRLSADPKGFIAGMKAASAALSGLRRDIDKTNDRTAWLAQSFLALGPAIGPLGAAVVPALAGLTTQLLATGLAAGVATLAFNGVGDALGALNDYQIDPTEAHLKKLHRTMAFIGPTGRDLVRELDKMRDGFIGLSNLARDNMFPGVIDGLHQLKTLFPQVEQIVVKTADALGDMAKSAGEGLSGKKFEDFFNFLESDGVPTIRALGDIVGNLAEGFGAMLAAFAPLSRDFTGGMLEMSQAFADWAQGLRESETFTEFVDYVQETTPKVLDLLGQMAETFTDIIVAAAPVGDQILPLLELFLDLVSAIVNSPLGPIIIAAAAAMSLYGRAAALATITTGKLGGKIGELALGLGKADGALKKGERRLGSYKASMGKAAGTAGIFALAMSPIPDKLGLSNTAMGAMTGSLAGPWGAAVGAGVGLLFDMNRNTEKFTISTQELYETLNKQTGAVTKNTKAWAYNVLYDEGVLRAAKDLGIGLDDVTEASLGNALAQERVTRALEAGRAAMLDADGRVKVSTEEWTTFRDNQFLVEDAIGGTNDALEEGRDKLLLTGEAAGTTTKKFKKAAEEIDYFGEAMDGLNDKLEQRGTFRAYQASIDAVAKSIRDNGKTLDINTQKGRDNQDALDGIASSALAVAEKLKGTERDEFLKHARENFVDAAKKLGKTETQARNLAKFLGLLDLVKASPEIKPKGYEKAHSDAKTLYDQLVVLDNFVANPRIVTARDTNWNYSEGPGFAEGGYTGEGDPSEPAGIVHRREFVFDAETTKRNIGLFQAIHKGMAGYQNGGYVAASAQPSMSAGMSIDYGRLAAAMANARPLYGDVEINGDPTVFRRQMREDAAAASVGRLS